MDDKPKTPGLKWRARKTGPAVPYWVASSAAIKAGYPVKAVRLTGDTPVIVGRCERLQAEMLIWMTGRSSARPAFDGTVGAVLEHYLTDPDSTYRKLKPSSRHPYDIYAGKLKGHIGPRRLDAIDRRDITRWFAVWSAPLEEGSRPRLAAARMAICVLKAALTFGKGCRLPGCGDLKAILEDMEFPGLRPRDVAPTAEQVTKARAAARAAGRPRRALAYAIQFETTLRQWDVIGQYVPLSDPRPSIVLAYGMKWLGPTWARIDDSMVLRLTPTKTEDTTEARVAFDLKECPMVMEELYALGVTDGRPSSQVHTGPLIINEATGLPYRHEVFRECWRADARAAGLPDRMWNRDLRAGGVTEGGQAGATLEDRARLAGHSKVKTTAEVYDRDTLEAHRRVARARGRHRTNDGGT